MVFNSIIVTITTSNVECDMRPFKLLRMLFHQAIARITPFDLKTLIPTLSLGKHPGKRQWLNWGCCSGVVSLLEPHSLTSPSLATSPISMSTCLWSFVVVSAMGGWLPSSAIKRLKPLLSASYEDPVRLRRALFSLYIWKDLKRKFWENMVRTSKLALDVQFSSFRSRENFYDSAFRSFHHWEILWLIRI